MGVASRPACAEAGRRGAGRRPRLPHRFTGGAAGDQPRYCADAGRHRVVWAWARLPRTLSGTDPRHCPRCDHAGGGEVSKGLVLPGYRGAAPRLMSDGFAARVAIIGGTGRLGLGLARRLQAAAVEVVIGSRGPARAETVAQSIGLPARVGQSNVEAAGSAEVIIVTVPYDAHAQILSGDRKSV